MSRYVKQLEGGKELAYGFDHAVGYFYDIFDNSPEIDNEYEAHVEGADSLFGYQKGPNTGKPFNRGHMAEILMEHEVDINHINAVAMDIAF